MSHCQRSNLTTFVHALTASSSNRYLRDTLSMRIARVEPYSEAETMHREMQFAVTAI